MVRGTGAAHAVPGPPVTSALPELWPALEALYTALLTPEAMKARLDLALVLLLATPIGTPTDGVGPPILPWVLWGLAGGRAAWAKLVKKYGEEGAHEEMAKRGRKGGRKGGPMKKLVEMHGEEGAHEEMAKRGRKGGQMTQKKLVEKYGEHGARKITEEWGREGGQMRVKKLVEKHGEDGAHMKAVEQGRKSRGEGAFSEAQYTVLEEAYAEDENPTPADMDDIADTAGLTKKQVSCWFRNKRTRVKRRRVKQRGG